MKGSEESEMAIGVIIFSIGLAALLGFVNVRLLLVQTSIETARGEMEVVDIAHMVVNCLSGEGTINPEKLDQETLDACGLESLFILITDMETGEEIWKHGKPEGEHGYSLAAPVLLGDGRVIGGDVYVKI
jgi:hypothetical protein